MFINVDSVGDMTEIVTKIKVDGRESLPKIRSYFYTHPSDIVQNTLNNLSKYHYLYTPAQDLNMWSLFGIGRIRQYLILNHKVKKNDKFRRGDDIYRYNKFRLLNNI
jgi:hypothetical protein